MALDMMGDRLRNYWSHSCHRGKICSVDALYDADVEPVYDASSFYAKLGFEFADPTEPLPPANPYRTMYLDLKPVIEALATEEADADQP